MRKLSVIMVVLVLCLLSTIAIPKSVSMTPTTALQDPLPVNQASTVVEAASVLTPTNIFLPMVTKNVRASCPIDSPFALQIAALHQVDPAASDVEGQAFTKEDWLAWYDEAFPDLVAALRDSGACWTRVRIEWQSIQPYPPPEPYNWNWHGEDRLAALASTGVHLIGTIDDVPDWARGEPFPDLRCTSIADAHLSDFAQFLTDLVNRYKQPPWNIHVWELRNEPDGTTQDRAAVGQGCAGDYGDKYAQMLGWAYPHIKAADPSATVLMGGVAYDNFTEYGGPFNRYFPDAVMANGGAANLDAINLHYFHDFYREWERWVPEGDPPTCGNVEDGEGDAYEAWGIDVIAKATHFRNRLSTCYGVDKPLWITELAEHGYPDRAETLDQQARYVVQGYARGLAAGVENITWFALISPPYDPSAHGLLFDDLTPKPGYYAYQTLTAELTGWDYAYTLNVPNVEGYVFGNERGEEKTVAWANGQAGMAVPLTIPAASQVRVVDRAGTVRFVQDGGAGDLDGAANGSVTVQLPAPPVDDDPAPPRYTAEPLFISK
jgi:hypothetical protein